MKLHNIKPAKGATKTNKRLGRGQGSGGGGTATRGHKGQKSRSGYSRKIGFEGGQMPLQRRVPKFGFTNPNRIEYKGINLDSLQQLADEKKVKEITAQILSDNGLCGKKELIKILGRGELKAKLKVTAHRFSATAKAAIEKAGGSAEIAEDAPSVKAPKTAPKKKKVVAKKAEEQAPVAEEAPVAKEAPKAEKETKSEEEE